MKPAKNRIKTKAARVATGRPFIKSNDSANLSHPVTDSQDALGIAMSRLLSGWQPEALHYLRRLRSTGKWAVLRICGGRRTWTPVSSRGEGVRLILSLGGAI